MNYLVEASYYADSSLQNETYPSVPGAGDRRVVSYTNDAAGRLVSLNSSATTYAPAASVSSIGYASHNALNTETYGNSLVHAITYNSRLQPNEIKLGTSGAPTSVVDLNYNYGATNNNGSVQSISYSGGGLSYTQSFGYDPLNRLTTSNENSGASWSQTTGFDQYGNRWIDYGGGNHDLSFSTSTNHITTSGFVYDASGNLLNDTLHSYTFDAENKISKVDNVSAYVYDGDGQRVRKLIGENLRFVYDMNGRQIAEFDGSNGNLKKEYLYGASLITIEPTAVNSNGTQYLTSDHLGSPRVTTNSSAAVVSRHDYMPFGEELGATVGGRTTGMGYGAADGLRQQFTRKERDNETGLDYFGARYYASAQGRFISVDQGAQELLEPQTWNRYQYARNNPLYYVDADGNKDEPAKNQRVNQALAADPTLLEVIKASVNFSQRAFEDALNKGALRGDLTTPEGNILRGLAGEANVIDHLRDFDAIHMTEGVFATTISSPLPLGRMMNPDILNVHLPVTATGAHVQAQLTHIASDPSGTTRSVDLSVNVVSVFFQVKAGFTPRHIGEGAAQVATMATALAATGGTGVAVLAVDRGAWMKLSPQRRQEIYNQVTQAGGYIQLWDGLAVKATQRSRAVARRAR